MWNLDDEFYDEEDIIAKLHHIQELTTRSHYIGWIGETPDFIQRIEQAVTALPAKHQKAALALFANTTYLPRSLLDEAWREAAYELGARTGWSSTSGFRDAMFIGIDDGGLVTDFSHAVELTLNSSDYTSMFRWAEGKTLDEYIRYRIDKACAVHKPDPSRPPKTFKIAYASELVSPYCVYVR